MEIFKETIYEKGTWSDSYLPYFEREGIAKEYRREDFESFEQYQRETRGRSGGQASRGANRDNRKSKKYGSGHTENTRNDVSPFMPILHSFKDISGKTKYVIKVDSEYYIKDNHGAQPAKSIHIKALI